MGPEYTKGTPTLREKLNIMLDDVEITPEQKAIIIGRIMGLTRPGTNDIVHQIGPNGFHRLVISGEKSPWSPQTDIIRVGDIVASTDAYINLLPQVGRVYAFKGKDFRTESVQTLID